MKRFIGLTCVTLLLIACGDDGNKKLKTPANLTADVVAEDQVNLIWEDRSKNEAGFEIQRAHQGEAFRILARTNAETTTINDKTVVLGAVYSYRVRAVSGSERSFYSNTVEIEVVVDRATAPTPPMGLQATDVTATTLTLTWLDTATNETGFEIERSRQADFTEAESFAADMNEARYEDSALAPETQYFYRARAVNAVGESAYSQTLSVQTAALPLAPPQAPTDLSANAVSSSRIDLEWADTSDNEAGFIIRVSSDGASFEDLRTTARNVRTMAHEGLSPETAYHYYVIAFNTAGESQRSAIAQAITQTQPLAAPSAPEDLTYSELTSSSVRLAWTDTATNEEGFRLERSQTSDFSLVDAFTLDPNVTTYQDTHLLPATDYFYRMAAFNLEGDSEMTDQIRLRTPDEIVPLPAPTALGLREATASTITLSWQDNSEGEDGFNVEVSTDGGATFLRHDTATANQTTYTHSGLISETTYHYRVNAYLGPQTSDYGNVLEVTTDRLPKPTLLEAASVLANSITLNWQDNSDNEMGFSLDRALDDTFIDAATIDLDANQTEYTDTSLIPETVYCYRIRAYDAAGFSIYSESISQATMSVPPAPAQ